MKLKYIVNKAGRCLTDESAAVLLEVIKNKFKKSEEFHNFEAINEEAYIEGGEFPHIYFELNRVVSNDYIILIEPVIRDNKFTIRVVTNRMNDGLGIYSKDWTALVEDELKLSPDDTLQYAINFSKNVAIRHHKALIESVGVEPNSAEEAALKSWK